MAKKAEVKSIKVERPFLYNGKVAKKGASLTVDVEFANQMVAANKAVFASAPVAVDPADDDSGKKGK